jgi:chaperonin GroES
MQKIPFTPLLDRVLLQEITNDKEVITRAGLILLETGNERPKKSKVIAAGETANIKPGAIVYHGKNAGFKLKFNEDEFIIIRAADIFGILED